MQKIKFINANGVEIDFTSGCYGVTGWKGLSNANLNLQTQKVLNYDGSVYIDGLLENRTIELTLCIDDNNNLAVRYAKRKELCEVLNPKLGEGYLVYKNDMYERRIKAIPELPVIENKNSDESGSVKAALSFICPDVYWEDVEETVVNIESGIRTNIINDGDVPCNVKIESFLSNVKNPKIENMTNNKSIMLNGIFNNYVSIDTNAGQKNVIKDKLISSPVSCSYYINDIAYSSKRKIYVALSYRYILVSKDKINWEFSTLGRSMYSICYNEENDIFVAVGANGYIETSNDGYNWTIRNSSDSDARTLNKIIYIDNSIYQGFVAVGRDVAISSDGITWNITNNVFSYFMYSIAYSDNFVVVVGGENTVGAWCRGLLSSSDNTISWDSTNTTDDNLGLYSVCYSNYTRCFVAVGNGGLIKVSDSNATTWNSLHPSPMFSGWILSIEFINEYKMFVGVTYDGRAVYSNDAINWTIYSFYDDIENLQGLKYLEKTGEAVIYGNYLLKTDFLEQFVPSSNWEYLLNNLNKTIYDVCFGQDKYVFACSQSIIYSPDLVNFTIIEFNDYTFYKIVYCETLNKFIALVNSGYAISSNAIDWEFFTSVSGEQLVCNDNIVIIRSAKTCYVSNDAINWKTSTITSDSNYQISSITIGNNAKCVAVGRDTSSSNKTVMFYNLSDSDLNFTWYKSDFNDSIASYSIDVCYSSEKKLFVTCSVWDVFYVSYDRVHWIRPMVLGGQTGGIYITYSDFYNLFFSFNGYILYISSDGYNWYEYDLYSATIPINSFKIIKDKIFLVGTDSNILISDFTFDENIISLLDVNSNINLNLDVGNNTFLLTSSSGEYSMKLTYRQKYLGV